MTRDAVVWEMVYQQSEKGNMVAYIVADALAYRVETLAEMGGALFKAHAIIQPVVRKLWWGT